MLSTGKHGDTQESLLLMFASLGFRAWGQGYGNLGLGLHVQDPHIPQLEETALPSGH